MSAHDIEALPVSLYVHVPFCVSKCAYCDFTSSPAPADWHRPYVDAVLFEAGHWSHYGLLDDVPTLYFGGGTPTVLGEELVRLLTLLRQTIELRPDAEITIETNPDTTDPALVAALVHAGANRFSLGVQSFDQSVLTTLGRRHDVESAVLAARTLRDCGARFSIDLMCGIPGQSIESWTDTLTRAIATGADHVSVYPLSIQEGTPLCDAVEGGRLPEPDPDVAAEMMLLADKTLFAAGVLRYETANYAKPGFEARHNTVYWTGGAYLGLGPGASSMLPAPTFADVVATEGWTRAEPRGLGIALPAPDDARARFSATSDIMRYLREPLRHITDVEYLSTTDALREDVMLGMRLAIGVPAEKVVEAGVEPQLHSLQADGLVELVAGRWRTTQRGWLLGNEVFGRIWTAE